MTTLLWLSAIDSLVAATAPTLSFGSDLSSTGDVRLLWWSTGADKCLAGGSWSGTKPLRGIQSMGLFSAPVKYTLTCSGAGGSITRSTTVQARPPQISLSASPTSIASGGSSTLTWSVTHATSCSASGAWSGTRALTGSQSTGPLTGTREYRLTCSGAGGGQSAAVTVNVAATTPAPTLTFTATPTTVAPQGSANLQWSATNATACTASGGWSGSRSTAGQQSTGPLSANRSYSLTCTGGGGTVARNVTVTVAEPAPISVTITANPASVARNGSTTLSWSSTGATGCTASGGWSGSRPTSGSATVGPLTQDTTYSLSCTDGSRSALRMTTVVLREHRLTWRAPTRNVDGTALTDLASYRIHYGNASRRYTQAITVSASTLSRTISLAPGTWYFAVTAVNSRGEESGYSNESSRVIP